MSFSSSTPILSDRLSLLLGTIPSSWRGTTFPNDARFVGRHSFIDTIYALLTDPSYRLNEALLEKLFPEDYVRLGSPLSTVLELIAAVHRNRNPHATFTFASQTLPIIAIVLCAAAKAKNTKHATPVIIYGSIPSALNADASSNDILSLSSLFATNVILASGEPKASDDGIVVLCQTASEHSNLSTAVPEFVDALVTSDGFLYVLSDKIPVDDVKNGAGDIVVPGIHTLRKRFGAPIPTPDVESILKAELLRLEGRGDGAVPIITPPSSSDYRSLNAHLLELGGVVSASDANDDLSSEVVLGTTGLAALAPLLLSAYTEGKTEADIVMCSTAYGGSSQQADILCDLMASGNLSKHCYDIQGGEEVLTAIKATLNRMKVAPKRKPITLVQVEYPTNPDMKDCDLSALMAILLNYEKETQSSVVLMLDTTFSPQSKAASIIDSSLALIIFNSLSKSVSGGFTTGGSLVANANPLARRLLALSHRYIRFLDTASKNTQLHILAQWHSSTETRVSRAHQNAIKCARHLEAAVLRISGQSLPGGVHFVTDAQIVKGVTPATFSFNLPAPTDLSSSQLEAVAQKFVDDLVANYPKGIKPCVSFGQENELVYATVPATSTQGVISASAKAKQAVGGVQLVRFSFPPSMNIKQWNRAIENALDDLYNGKKKLYCRIAAGIVGVLVSGVAIYSFISKKKNCCNQEIIEK